MIRGIGRHSRHWARPNASTQCQLRDNGSSPRSTEALEFSSAESTASYLPTSNACDMMFGDKKKEWE